MFDKILNCEIYALHLQRIRVHIIRPWMPSVYTWCSSWVIQQIPKPFFAHMSIRISESNHSLLHYVIRLLARSTPTVKKLLPARSRTLWIRQCSKLLASIRWSNLLWFLQWLGKYVLFEGTHKTCTKFLGCWMETPRSHPPGLAHVNYMPWQHLIMSLL